MEEISGIKIFNDLKYILYADMGIVGSALFYILVILRPKNGLYNRHTSISPAKLCPTSNSLVWGLGSGSGS